MSAQNKKRNCYRFFFSVISNIKFASQPMLKLLISQGKFELDCSFNVIVSDLADCSSTIELMKLSVLLFSGQKFLMSALNWLQASIYSILNSWVNIQGVVILRAFHCFLTCVACWLSAQTAAIVVGL